MLPDVKLLISLILLFASTLLARSDFTYTLKVSTHTPFVKEAVMLTLELRQTDPKAIMRFSFAPPKSDAYEAKLLGSDEIAEAGEIAHVRYTYVLFPLKSGDITIPLSCIVSRTTKEELKKFVTGSADELTYLGTNDRRVALTTLRLHVRPLPAGSDLVGSYRLSYTLDHNTTSAQNQINLTYTLQGRGYPPKIDRLLPPISGVTLFSDKRPFNSGLFHKVIYRYALLASEDFEIPPIRLGVFDPATGKLKRVTAPRIPIHILPAATSPSHSGAASVADNLFHDLPLRGWLRGILLFLAGFIVALLYDSLIAPFRSADPFERQVVAAKRPKELLALLLSREDRTWEPHIAQLEALCYEKRHSTSFKQIKKAVISALHEVSLSKRS